MGYNPINYSSIYHQQKPACEIGSTLAPHQPIARLSSLGHHPVGTRWKASDVFTALSPPAFHESHHLWARSQHFSWREVGARSSGSDQENQPFIFFWNLKMTWFGGIVYQNWDDVTWPFQKWLLDDLHVIIIVGFTTLSICLLLKHPYQAPWISGHNAYHLSWIP